MFSCCTDEETRDQKGLVTSLRLHSEARAGVLSSGFSGLKVCVFACKGQRQVVWLEARGRLGGRGTARKVGGPQR